MKLAQLLDSLKRAYDAAKRLASSGDQLYRMARRAMAVIHNNLASILGDSLTATAFLMGRY